VNDGCDGGKGGARDDDGIGVKVMVGMALVVVVILTKIVLVESLCTLQVSTGAHPAIQTRIAPEQSHIHTHTYTHIHTHTYTHIHTNMP
jgi:hypothetical protein